MGYDASITRVGAMALFDLKGTQSGIANWAGAALPRFPARPNTASAKGEVDLLFVGRDHWFLRAPLKSEAEIEAALKPANSPPDLSIVRISDTLTFFSITGSDAGQIMSIASPLDLHPTVFPENGATFTEAFGLKALVTRQHGGFWLAVEQSYGDMIEDYLTRTMS